MTRILRQDPNKDLNKNVNINVKNPFEDTKILSQKKLRKLKKTIIKSLKLEC